MRPSEHASRGPRGVWRTLGITRKLGLAFLLLLALVVLVSLAALAALALVDSAENEMVQSMEIRQKVFEMDGEREKARRFYQSFLLSYPEIGFFRAQETYGQPAFATAARVIALSEELKRLITGSSVSANLRRRNVDMALYLSFSRRFSAILMQNMELLTSLAEPENGLWVRMDRAMASLEAALAGSRNLSLLLREANVFAKQYRLTRQRPQMQSAFNVLTRLRAQLPADPALDAPRRAEAAALLDGYVALADKLLDTHEVIRSTFNDFVLQARAVDPVSQELKEASSAEVERARTRIAWVGRAAGGLVVAATLFGLACAVAIAYAINASVTRKIADMTRRAAELRAGNLEITVAAEPGDELGELGATFNAMTQRVRDLVENLEDNVRQRTAELDEKNRELDRTNRTLEVLSQTDRLTGLCNRRRLDQALRAELRRAKRYRKPFSVIMIDVDHFKEVNDRHGHQVGDDVLVRLADIFAGLARETDTVGRWGGEEFLVVCPETGPDVARNLAQRLRAEIEETVFPVAGRLTASFGVAASAEEDDPDALVQRADTALYRAKQHGRNRIETF